MMVNNIGKLKHFISFIFIIVFISNIEIDDIDSDDGVDIIGGVKADSLFDNKKSKAKKRTQKLTAAQQLRQEQVSLNVEFLIFFLLKQFLKQIGEPSEKHLSHPREW